MKTEKEIKRRLIEAYQQKIEFLENNEGVNRISGYIEALKYVLDLKDIKELIQ